MTRVGADSSIPGQYSLRMSLVRRLLYVMRRPSVFAGNPRVSVIQGVNHHSGIAKSGGYWATGEGVGRGYNRLERSGGDFVSRLCAGYQRQNVAASEGGSPGLAAVLYDDVVLFLASGLAR